MSSAHVLAPVLTMSVHPLCAQEKRQPLIPLGGARSHSRLLLFHPPSTKSWSQNQEAGSLQFGLDTLELIRNTQAWAHPSILCVKWRDSKKPSRLQTWV